VEVVHSASVISYFLEEFVTKISPSEACSLVPALLHPIPGNVLPASSSESIRIVTLEMVRSAARDVIIPAGVRAAASNNAHTCLLSFFINLPSLFYLHCIKAI
jgi:hypothetical protein